ncbi:hypothetical protein L2E82_47808 [Cichorium intybus]|uniref:Uncharacterized protein n=1 Tax=Cichorium intybus TaxID=13427 RepID=A0ACB8YXK7_CICIN|nr:hypothetical protein L2E82_47808 [Cichorium intybus]
MPPGQDSEVDVLNWVYTPFITDQRQAKSELEYFCRFGPPVCDLVELHLWQILGLFLWACSPSLWASSPCDALRAARWNSEDPPIGWLF